MVEITLVIILALILRGVKRFIDIQHMTEEELLYSVHSFFLGYGIICR